LRPPAELIRTRKPCAFLRFRLLGLNEGFMISPCVGIKALILNNPGSDVKTKIDPSFAGRGSSPYQKARSFAF
jgi:hypothetical protein